MLGRRSDEGGEGGEGGGEGGAPEPAQGWREARKERGESAAELAQLSWMGELVGEKGVGRRGRCVGKAAGPGRGSGQPCGGLWG